MFKNEDILDFLTRIIKNSNANNIEASKDSIEKFKEYLMLIKYYLLIQIL